MQAFCELVRQKGERHIERYVVRPEDIPNEIAKHPEDAWFRSSVYFLSDEDLCLKQPDSKTLTELFSKCLKTAPVFFLDFDGEQTAIVQELTALFHQLPSAASVPVRVFESGSKGIHLEFPILSSPKTELLSVFKTILKNITSSLTLTTGKIPSTSTLDQSIYNDRRAWRIEGTTHQSTGRVKREISLKDFLQGQVVYIPPTNPAPIPLEELQAAFSRGSRDFPPFIQKALIEGFPKGKRNNGIYSISLFFKKLGLIREEANAVLLESPFVRDSDLSSDEVTRTIKSAYDSSHSFGLTNSVLADFASPSDRALLKAESDEEYERWSDVAMRFVKSIENPAPPVLVKYHTPALDKRMGGIASGELIVLGGVTGTGKSEFAFNVAKGNAKSGVPVGFITLELGNDDFMKRVMRSSSGMDAAAFWSGNYGANKSALRDLAMREAEEDIPLFFRKRKKMMNVGEISGLVSKLIEREKVKFIVIDHLHYVAGGEKFERESAHVSHAIREINTMCTSLGVAIMTVAHFKKVPDPSYRPTMHDFRDSSSIEQEASTVLLVWRNVAGLMGHQYDTEFTVAKSRKDIPFQIIKTRFDVMTRTYLETPLL